MSIALWRLAFRPLFLGGSLFSVLAVAIWAAALEGKLQFTPAMSMHAWHAHEMLFGFVIAIVSGFLLTAVQTWTQLRAVHGLSLAFLFSVWIAARILMLVGGNLPSWLVAFVDISYLPLVGILMARLVIKARNYRNLVFVPVLLLLALANTLTHFGYFSWGMYASIWLVSLLMTVVGGRVIPMFTANGTQSQKVEPLPWLERATLFLMWLIAVIYLVNSAARMPPMVMAMIFAAASIANAWRAWRWRPWVTTRVRLVWSLHAAYWFIPLGLGLFALHFAGVNINASTAMHALTAGAMGSLILAMLARVSLGHTGRPLEIHPAMKYAFLLVIFAGLYRLAAGLKPALTANHGYTISAIAWCLAYGLFFVLYARILRSPRPDGKDG